MEDKKQFVNIGVEPRTRRMISILAKVLSTPGHKVNIYELVASWVDEAWKKAKKEKLVTDAMLEPRQAHFLGKKTVVRLDDDDSVKLLDVVMG